MLFKHSSVVIICVSFLQCIVQSYLQWLQDSDYDPNCRLCGKSLGEESSGECSRLTCYGKVLTLQALKVFA